MENKKKKSPVTIMLVISLIVMVLGLVCGVSVYYEVTNRIPENSGVYVDGADLSGLISVLGQAGAFILSAVIVFASFFAVGMQWAVYFIVKLIKNHSDKNNQQQMYIHNNNMM